jgi:hypothetical protein
MTDLKTYQVYAVSLLADLQAVAKNSVPRREVLLDWLDDFLERTKTRGFKMAQGEVENLIALDQFVHRNGIPATVRAALE